MCVSLESRLPSSCAVPGVVPKCCKNHWLMDLKTPVGMLQCSSPTVSESNYPAAPGFGGHYTNKAGRTREGCATFFQRARLRLVQREDVSLKELFAPLLTPPAAGRGARHARFAPMLRESPALAAALQKVRAWQQMPRTSTYLRKQIVSSRMNPFSLFFFGGHCLC